MTTFTSTNSVKPTKPWKVTKRQLIPSFSLLIAAAIATYLVVLLTPMKGKLAYVLLFFIFGTGFQAALSWSKRGKSAAIDTLAASIMMTGGMLVFLPVVSLLYTTIVKGFKGLRPQIFTHTMESTSYSDPLTSGGLLHAIIGTLFLIAIATVISLPLSILTALYLTEIKGKASGFIQFLVQAMSGVPSVVAGIFIYAALLLTTDLRGSTIIGALPLAILMIPTVTRTAQEVLLLVPNELREAGLALGATQWKTVATIVVPAARNGLITAVILGVARIAGETAPLLFTLGTSDKINWNIFSGGQNALPYYVWSGLRDGTEGGLQRAWTGILVLLMLVLTLFVSARIFGSRKVK
ncbi:MAG: phosphate ABC transporter permease PstA [Candidatus Nanopelagicaceae bacterium]|jgi:phosphate transport system permease protein